MRILQRIAGTLLLLIGCIAAVLTFRQLYLDRGPTRSLDAELPQRTQQPTGGPAPEIAGGSPKENGEDEVAGVRVPEPTIAPWRPIARLSLPSIALDTPVVVAPYRAENGGTWDVPPFVAGHAELTGAPGRPGNAVIFGHVTSVTLGNVFQDLDEARLGDLVQVWSDGDLFDYRVVEIRSVARDDVSVVQPTDTPSLTMITCTGAWLPLLQDYSHRLVVRAELERAVASAPARAG